MQVKSIKEIRKYKSFIHYKWNNFFNANTFADNNLIFGENGSGKSAIVKIFKDLSNYKSFEKIFPDSVTIRINTQDYKFSDKIWNQKISNKSILFFDTNFIKENIHIANERRAGQNEQEQKSGKLIIEFDKKAIELNKKQIEAKRKLEEKKKEIENFEKKHRNILDFNLPEEHLKNYEQYKDLEKEKLLKEKEDLENQKNDITKQIEKDKKISKNTEAISQIADLSKNNFEVSFSSIEQYQNVFSYDLKEQVKIDAKEELIKKINTEQSFFEKGIELFKKDNTKCPFCQSTKVVNDVEHIIKLYNKIFDNTYELAKREFEKQKSTLLSEIGEITTTNKNIKQEGNKIFLKLKELQEEFSIPDIYSIEEEKNFKDISITDINKLKSKLEQLKKPTKEDIIEIYNLAKQEVNNLIDLINRLNKLIDKKQKLINEFKDRNTNEKINERLNQNKEKLELITAKIKFLNSDYIKQQKEKIQKEEELKTLKQEKNEIDKNHKKAKEEYEKYCSGEVFQNTLKKIEEYFDYFNFEFNLKLKTQKIGNKKEIPFSFDILDNQGIKRDFSEGLSEGERQVLSLCFFFAFTNIQEDKDNKILVFDDPITSLDNNNLFSLVDLIYKKSKEFSQSFIFTHHLTFFRYLEKKYKYDKQTNKYLLMRNSNALGGSFLCGYINKNKSIIVKIKNIEKNIKEKSQPNGIDLQLETVKYGQYLRFETERLVKNQLLHWNKSDFPKQVEGIKNNQKLEDEDFEILKNVYSFCNWSNTSHIGYDDQTSFEQLKTNITNFLKVYDKLNGTE